jgi:hypothetical protein
MAVNIPLTRVPDAPSELGTNSSIKGSGDSCAQAISQAQSRCLLILPVRQKSPQFPLHPSSFVNSLVITPGLTRTLTDRALQRSVSPPIIPTSRGPLLTED